MTSNKTSLLKQSLLDFQSEMRSQLLEDTFTVHDKRWTMKLLTEEEQTWGTGMMNTTNVVSIGLSGRLATLAIGIRAIDDKPVYEYFAEDWDDLGAAAKDALENMNKFAMKYFVAEHLYMFLAAMPPEVTTDLYKSWEKLIERRAKAQETSKKSSGETLPPESNES